MTIRNSAEYLPIAEYVGQRGQLFVRDAEGYESLAFAIHSRAARSGQPTEENDMFELIAFVCAATAAVIQPDLRTVELTLGAAPYSEDCSYTIERTDDAAQAVGTVTVTAALPPLAAADFPISGLVGEVLTVDVVQMSGN